MRVAAFLLVLLALVASASAFTLPSLQERRLKAQQGLRTIAVQDHPDGPVVLRFLTPAEVSYLPTPGRKTHFMDLTDFDADLAALPVPASVDTIPVDPRHHNLVKSVIQDHLCTASGNCHEEIMRMITRLSNFHTRYYTQPTAVEAANFVKSQYEETAGSRLGRDIQVSFFEHRWAQPSVITRVQGSRYPDEIVVIGGHIDSTVGNPTARSPGADDDASGSSTVFAAFKALMAAGYVPERTVEFHAYSAEEAGLLGSADVAQEYKRQGRNVVSMTQFDMTGYSVQKVVGLIRDNTNSRLTDFIAKLLITYTDIRGGDSRCGYGCSDHASWTKQGYAAAFPFEAPFGNHNPQIHTVNDVIQNLDPVYMGNFAKLAVAYVIELSKL